MSNVTHFCSGYHTITIAQCYPQTSIINILDSETFLTHKHPRANFVTSLVYHQASRARKQVTAQLIDASDAVHLFNSTL